MSDEVLCPQCNHFDAVFKASTLYEYGFSIEKYERVIPPPPGTKWPILIKQEEQTVQNALSKKLSPPQKPKPAYITGGMIIVTIVVWIVVACTILPIFNGNSQSTTCIVGLGWILYLGLLIWWFLSHKKSEDNRVEKLMPDWSRAMERWNRLYYCSRDDLVFDPSDGSSAPASQMDQLIHRAL